MHDSSAIVSVFGRQSSLLCFYIFTAHHNVIIIHFVRIVQIIAASMFVFSRKKPMDCRDVKGPNFSEKITYSILLGSMECRRGLTMRFLSVCLSVCLSVFPSVKRVHCDKTEESNV